MGQGQIRARPRDTYRRRWLRHSGDGGVMSATGGGRRRRPHLLAGESKVGPRMIWWIDSSIHHGDWPRYLMKQGHGPPLIAATNGKGKAELNCDPFNHGSAALGISGCRAHHHVPKVSRWSCMCQGCFWWTSMVPARGQRLPRQGETSELRRCDWMELIK
jgi:hypothetical protein